MLRRARPDDLDAIHEVMRRPEAMRYWSTPPHRTLEESREWLASMIEDSPALRDDFVIEHEGRVIGKAGCWRLPEVGFILHPDYWGRGLAREALSAVVARLFARYPIDAITADVDPRNASSLRLLEGLGFEVAGRAAGTWQVGDELCDSVYLALRRPEAS